jgi:YHS domain-containing protein
MEVAMIEQPTMATDPVCGMTVEIEHARAAGLTSEREGQTYFFCGKGRQLDFEKDPATYLDPAYRPSMEM